MESSVSELQLKLGRFSRYESVWLHCDGRLLNISGILPILRVDGRDSGRKAAEGEHDARPQDAASR
jgi:hypothetical protein